MRHLLFSLLLAAGCDTVFRVDRVSDGDAASDAPSSDGAGDAPVDAPVDGPSVLTCDQSPVILRPTGVFELAWPDQYPASGTHLDKVIDAGGADGDATYIATAGDGQFELYTHLPLDPSVTVESVSFWARARLVAPAAQSVQLGPAFRVGSAVNWDDRALTTAWGDVMSDTYVTDPVTGLPWTVEAVNGTAFGVRKAYTERVLVTQIWATVACRSSD